MCFMFTYSPRASDCRCCQSAMLGSTTVYIRWHHAMATTTARTLQLYVHTNNAMYDGGWCTFIHLDNETPQRLLWSLPGAVPLRINIARSEWAGLTLTHGTSRPCDSDRGTRARSASVNNMQPEWLMSACILRPGLDCKFFHSFSINQIFRHMHGVLNVDKKN